MGRHADTSALQVSTGRLLKSAAIDLVLERTSPEDAAIVVLNQPAIADALAAADVVEHLRGLHYAVPRVEGSRDVVCRHCHIGWPCQHAEILGVRA